MSRSDLEQVAALMHIAADVIAQFPRGFVPSDAEPPRKNLGVDAIVHGTGTSVEQLMAETEVAAWMHATIRSWPRQLWPAFLESSSILGRILEMFGVKAEPGMADIMLAATTDVRALEMLARLGGMRGIRVDDQAVDPLGMQQAVMRDLMRRGLARRTPFARTMTTLLGDDALIWLTARSEKGVGNLQPHEFARTGWPRIQDIENQLAIEQELLAIPAEAEHLARIVVTLCWTIAALASFIEPGMFLGEKTSHVSSVRQGMQTLSFGESTHTIVAFDTASLLPMIRILADGLTNPLMTAADLMWIGAAVARVREVQSGHGEGKARSDERFDIFLSHRGVDAKLRLSRSVESLQRTHGVFLDCMTLPHGVVNRSFVYSSLAHSDRVLIVDTEHFQESEWCRKEAWLADAMAAHGLLETERITLDAATSRVAMDGPRSTRRRRVAALSYPIAPRILSDLDYWGRQPNLHTLKENGQSTESLAPLEAVLKHEPLPDDPQWLRAISTAVTETLSKVTTTAPDGEPFALWSSALQLSVAAFGSTSEALSKMEVRRAVDRLNEVVRTLIVSGMHTEPLFRAQAAEHLALIAAAAAMELAAFELDPRMTPTIRHAVGDVAATQDGILLLDVRKPGDMRAFRLRFVAALVRGNLGSVGIVQNAADEVHLGYVDDLPLEVLPCITLYPGMAAPF